MSEKILNAHFLIRLYECLRTLKLKSEALQKDNKKLICALIFDEMGINKGFQRTRDGKMRGNVDIGTGIHNNCPENISSNHIRQD